MKQVPLLLFAFLVSASCGFAQPAPQQPSAAQQWRQSQETNAPDAYAFTRFTLLGKYSAAGADTGRPALVVDCIPGSANHRKGKFLHARLVVGSTLKVIYVEPNEIHGTSYFPKIAVRYSTEGPGKEERENWSPGTEKTAASVPKSALKKILRASGVAITAQNEQGSDISMQFDIPDPAIVEDSCRVDER